MPLIDVATAAGTVKFNYEVLGEDTCPPIVFISGYTCDINHWREVAKVMSKTHRVLIFDNQGIGKTKNHGGPLTIEEMARNTKALMDALGFGKATVIGFAMGSTIAQQLAKDAPDGVSRLILLSTVLKWGDEAKARINRLVALREEGKDIELAETIFDQAFGTTFKAANEREAFVAGFSIQNLPQSLEDQKRQRDALLEFDSSAWAASIRVPVHVLAPKEDLFALPNDGRAVAEATGGTYHVIDCGHCVTIEALEALTEYCQRLSAIAVPEYAGPIRRSEGASRYDAKQVETPDAGL